MKGSKNMSQVLLIDANPLFRLGLRELIKAEHPNLNVVDAESFANARTLLRIKNDFVVIILDIKIPDSGGFVGLFQLRTEFPGLPVIVLSNSVDTDSVSRAVSFGAAGYISKSASCDVISRLLRSCLAERNWTPVQIIAEENQVNPIAALSPAQMRVLNGLKRGLPNKQIAFELGLTEKTVKAYLSMLYRKLGVSSRTQAVILLQELMVEPHIMEPAIQQGAGI